jgi:hypothetical protein
VQTSTKLAPFLVETHSVGELEPRMSTFLFCVALGSWCSPPLCGGCEDTNRNRLKTQDDHDQDCVNSLDSASLSETDQRPGLNELGTDLHNQSRIWRQTVIK